MTEREDPSDAKEPFDLGFLQQADGVYVNVYSNYILITEDKLRIHLTNSAKKLERKTAWIPPLAILMTIFLAFVTADFKDFVLKASAWETLFGFAMILVFGWLIYSIFKAIGSETLDGLIEKIKKESK